MLPDPKAPVRRVRSWPQRLLLAVATLSLSCGAAELLVRTFAVADGRYRGRPLPPYGAINHPAQQQLHERRLRAWSEGRGRDGPFPFDRDLGWTVAPSQPGIDGTGSSNAWAARGPREYAPLPPPGVDRVLTFGDSFTYCNQVADDATWQVQAELADDRLEVVNFGVPSYGTDQALLRFRRDGRDRGARAIVLGLMLENIGRNVNRYRPIYFASSGTLAVKPRFALGPDGELFVVPLPYRDELAALHAIGDGSVLSDLAAHEYWLDRPYVPFGTTFAALRLAFGWVGYRQRRPLTMWADPHAEPYRVTVALLAAFAAEARAAGAELAPILVFPTEDDLDALVGGKDKYWQHLLRDLAVRRLDCIDASDTLAAECRRHGGGAALLFGGGHLNARGNALVAGLMQGWLRERL